MLFQTASHPVFQLLAQMAHVCLHSESGYTLAFQRKIAHSGSHGETRGISDGGGITTLGAFHTVRKPCVAGYQNGKLCRFWVLAGCTPKGRRKPAGQRCAYARRCPAGVAAPLGCVIFFAFVEIAACTPYSRYFFRFSRRSSLCCSCASCVSARSLSARSCSRVFGFVIVIDLLFENGDKKRPLISHTAV